MHGSRRTFQVVAALLLACVLPAAQGRARRGEVEPQVFIATVDGFATGSGSLLAARGGPPWSVSTIGATGGGRFLRRFGRFLYVVDTDCGTIARLRRDGGVVQELDLGPLSAPEDVRPVGPSHAYVTRRENPSLLRLDLTTGVGVDVVDLAGFAGEDEDLFVRKMASDGDHLFVQVDLRGPLGASRGLLAVVDTTTEELVDVDPVEPGVQGVELAGAPPQLRMQVLGRTLYVSTTGDRLDNRGGIEMVDLDLLESVGFALVEAQTGGADLGGFVMLSPNEGYAVVHTDIVPSTHLRHFTFPGGLTPGPDLITLLGDAVEALAYDPRTERLYLPTGFAGFGSPIGVFVLDTRTNRLLGEPIDTGERPQDVVVAR